MRSNFDKAVMPCPETVRVTVESHMCTKDFLNYLSVIVVFFESYFKDEIVKFSKNCGTFTIKESGGVKVQIMEKITNYY